MSNSVLDRLWRKYIADECPDARRERLWLEFMNDLKQDPDLREAMILWELENQKSRLLESETPSLS